MQGWTVYTESNNSNRVLCRLPKNPATAQMAKKTRKGSVSGAAGAKAGGRAKGAGQDSAKKAREIPFGKYSSDQVDKIYE